MQKEGEELIDDLNQRIKGCRREAQINERWGRTLLALTFFASTLATVSIAAGWFAKEINAGLMALSACLAGANYSFRFQDQATWWYAKLHGLDGFLRRLRDGREEPATVSKEMSAFLNKHAKDWPRIILVRPPK